jgi:hypothetical protein
MNSIWKCVSGYLRCHSEDSKTLTNLKNLSGSVLANIYFFKERVFAKDYDVPIGLKTFVEKSLGTKTRYE